MTFELWGFNRSAYFSPPAGWFGYALILGYAFIGLWALGAHLRPLFRLSPARWLALLALCAAGGLLAQLFILRFPANILPPPGVPAESQRPGLALFALLPAFLAGGWLGVAPALIVGFVTGLSRGAWETSSWLTPFEYTLVAFASAWALRQDYRGWPGRVLRYAVVAGLTAALVLWPLVILSYFAYSPTQGLPGWDYVWSQSAAAIPIFMAQAALAGLLAQFFQLGLPVWWVQPGRLRPPPYLASLNAKLLYALLPVYVVGLLLLLWANISIATAVSTSLVVDQMAAVADTAGQGIPFFVQTGQNLIDNIADQTDLSAEHADQVKGLSKNLRSIPFFRQLTLFDASLAPVAGYPADAGAERDLRSDERELVRLALAGIPQSAVIYPSTPAEPVDVVFAVPVGGGGGALMGRADLANNPLMQSVTKGLGGLANGLGQGFIIDEHGTIIYHPDPQRRLGTFTPESSSTPLTTSLIGASAYQDKAPDGTRRLVLYYPVPGHPWSVVVMVPNVVVLTQASQISTPVTAIMLLIGAIGLLIISLIAGRVTRPAVMLAQAALSISEGRLDQPIEITGEDEVGRASKAFELMRQRLSARLDELNMLLRVSQGVASSLSLADSLPPILQGAFYATGASGARIVLLPNDDGRALDGAPAAQVFGAGPAAEAMAPLDQNLLQLTRDGPQVVLENLSRARTMVDVDAVAGRLEALVALPLRQENTFYGTLWLAFDKPHTFPQSELNLLNTLAGQAAVSVANTHLFEAAEQGRQRLAAILASTPDAVVVTDRSERVLLLNPAAEAAFQLAGRPVIGRPVAQVLPNPKLVKLLQDGRSGGITPAATGEVEIAAGRTLLASASTIISADGSVLGRVCVLRDVTHFKELDEMKSEFVATVSHDLRAPLTFMRGYATMLPMVGALNEKQREFGDKIIGGVAQMTVLIDNLLDLGRIEAGVGLAREPVRMSEVIAEVMESLSPNAVNKRIRLQVDAPETLPSLPGDPTLLRQAVANLLDNAFKYTPNGGEVRVCASADGSSFQLAVSDTGPGIAPADQLHLFEKFFRVRQRGSSAVKGSGLGLAIVKSIVERHGGRAWMESKLGQGSTFFFSLPLSGGPAEPRNGPSH
jgi:PAS domain S-box-containing protein